MSERLLPSKRGEWTRWGRGMCEGYSLEIGNAFRGSVVRQDRVDKPATWIASVNAGYLGEYLDRASAMARVESDITTWKWCCTIGSCIGRRRRTSQVDAMCGRFTNRLTWEEMVRLYRLTLDQPARNVQARYNICPTDPIDAVAERDGKRELVPMRWGLVPNWWSKPLKEMKAATFNARVETVTDKPFFRDGFRRTHCIIPASGYYEWQNTSSGKQPYYFTAADGSPLSIAGLGDEWRDHETGEKLKSCTMIIANANDFVGQVHDRMPALLQPRNFDARLRAQSGLEVIKPAANDGIDRWRHPSHTENAVRSRIPETNNALLVRGDNRIGTRGKNGFGECVRKAHDWISQEHVATRMMLKRCRG